MEWLHSICSSRLRLRELLSGGHHGMDALLSRHSGCELLLAAIDGITTIVEEVYCMYLRRWISLYLVLVQEVTQHSLWKDGISSTSWIVSLAQASQQIW